MKVNTEKIRELLKTKNMTQKSVAEAVGVSEQMISYIIKGLREPSLTVLGRIAKELGCSTSELITD